MQFYVNRLESKKKEIGQIYIEVVSTRIAQVQHLKARLHRRFLSHQLNAIFVAPKLQPFAISLRF